MLVGVSFIAISQNETVEGDLTVDGDILNPSGSGGTLTLFDNDANKINRIILGADVNGAFIQSAYNTVGTDAFLIRNSQRENVFLFLGILTLV